MKKYKIFIVTLIVFSLFTISMVALASSSPGHVIPQKEPSDKAKQLEKNLGKPVELDIPIIIETKDGRTYRTTTKNFMKDKARIEKELGVKL